MKKRIIIASLIGSGIVLLDVLGSSHALLLFVFAGVIPGTEQRISAVDMLAAYATAITVLILYVTLWHKIRHIVIPQQAAAPTPTSKRSRRRTA